MLYLPDRGHDGADHCHSGCYQESVLLRVPFPQDGQRVI